MTLKDPCEWMATSSIIDELARAVNAFARQAAWFDSGDCCFMVTGSVLAEEELMMLVRKTVRMAKKFR